MRKFVFVLIAILVLVVPTFAQEQVPVVNSNLEQVLSDLTGDDGILELAVGESRDITVTVTSDTPWLSASLVPDSEFPGRGVAYAQRDTARGGTEATLTITVTAKDANNNRGDLPLRAVLAVRYQGGYVDVEIGSFTVVVTE